MKKLFLAFFLLSFFGPLFSFHIAFADDNKKSCAAQLSKRKIVDVVQLGELPNPTKSELLQGITYKIGVYTFSAQLIEDSGHAKINISVSPFDNYELESWDFKRDLTQWSDRSWENAFDKKKDWYLRESSPTSTVYDMSSALQESLFTRSLSFSVSTKAADLSEFASVIKLNGFMSAFVKQVFIYPFIDSHTAQFSQIISSSEVKKLYWSDIMVKVPKKATSLEQVSLVILERFMIQRFRFPKKPAYWDKVFSSPSIQQDIVLKNNLAPLSSHTLIVNHASSFFDEDRTAMIGLNDTIRLFRNHGAPIINFMSAGSNIDWYGDLEGISENYFSAGGEHNLTLASGVNEVTIVGGFFGDLNADNGCLQQNWINFIYNYFEMSPNSSEALTINLPINGMYYYSDHGYTQSDNPDKFMDLYDTVHMFEEDGEYSNLPYNQYSPILKREDYRFEFYADGELKRVANPEKKKIVRLKFWSQLPENLLEPQ